MGRKEELLNETVNAYVEATDSTPDTRDFVAIQDRVEDYMNNEGKEENS